MIRFGDLNPALASKLSALAGALGHDYDVDLGVQLDSGREHFLAGRRALTLLPAAQAVAQEKAREITRYWQDSGEAVDLALSLTTCAQSFLGSLAAQIESGTLDPVTDATARQKLRLHQPSTYGVATGATLRALRSARPTVRRTG